MCRCKTDSGETFCTLKIPGVTKSIEEQRGKYLNTNVDGMAKAFR